MDESWQTTQTEEAC